MLTYYRLDLRTYLSQIIALLSVWNSEKLTSLLPQVTILMLDLMNQNAKAAALIFNRYRIWNKFLFVQFTLT